jgi:tetratricopeptide (TPR) repeat protein
MVTRTVHKELKLGRRLFERQDYSAVVMRCQRLLQASPEDTQALELLGASCIALGRYDEAMGYLRQALQLAPERRTIYLRLAAALERSGRCREAIALLSRALTQFGADAELLYNLGISLQAEGQTLPAIDCYQRCLQQQPGLAEAHNNLGVVLSWAGRHEEAAASLERALALRPDYLRPLVNLGRTLGALGRYQEAAQCSRAALNLAPDSVPAMTHLGLALSDLGRDEEAASWLERAVQGGAPSARVLASLATVLFRLGRTAESAELLRQADALNDTDPDVRAALGAALFHTGQWRRAWRYLEARFMRLENPTRIEVPPGSTPWDGQIRPGLQLVLVAEQGLGDMMQFVRYAQPLVERGVRPALQCHPRLTQLLSETGWFVSVTPIGSPVPQGYTWYPLMSMPYWCQTSPESVPEAGGYLSAPPARRAEWGAKLDQNARYHVGIAWQGNPDAERQQLRGRSVPLSAFGPLTKIPGVRLYSLQKGPGSEQIDGVDFGAQIVRLGEQLDGGPQAFLDTAAVIAQLDLVICCDTSIAHLAGALGKPVWVALHTRPDWRWGLAGERTPWYSSMRLFRQPRDGDWPSVFEAVSGALLETLAPSVM